MSDLFSGFAAIVVGVAAAVGGLFTPVHAPNVVEHQFDKAFVEVDKIYDSPYAKSTYTAPVSNLPSGSTAGVTAKEITKPVKSVVTRVKEVVNTTVSNSVNDKIWDRIKAREDTERRMREAQVEPVAPHLVEVNSVVTDVDISSEVVDSNSKIGVIDILPAGLTGNERIVLDDGYVLVYDGGHIYKESPNYLVESAKWEQLTTDEQFYSNSMPERMLQRMSVEEFQKEYQEYIANKTD